MRLGRAFPCRPLLPKLLAFAASGAPYTLACDVGAFVLDGQAAALHRASRITCEVGTFDVSGQAAALLRQLKLTAEVGAYSLAGQDAILAKGTRIACEVGAFAVAGQAAGLFHHAVLACAAGVFTLSGQDVTLTWSGLDPGGASGNTFPMGLPGGASVTLPAAVVGLLVSAVQWSGSPESIDITGDDFDGVADTGRAYARGIPTEEIILRGVVMGSQAGFAPSSTLTLTTAGAVAIDVLPDRWSLTKWWELWPITGDSFSRASGGDGRQKWDWGIPRYSLSFYGHPMNDGPGITREEMLMSLAADSIGTIAFVGSLHATGWSLPMNLPRGRRPAVTFSGLLAGPVSYTPGTAPNDFSWLFDAADPADGDIDIETGGGEVISARTLIYAVTLDFAKARGSAIRFDARARVDSEVL